MMLEKLKRIEDLLYWSSGELYGTSFEEVCRIIRELMAELGEKPQYETKCEEMW